MGFREELRQQRWDDHRYYHHSRINQSLHFLSSISFLVSYAILLVSPHIAAIIGWVVAMWSRQIGHFFFEPKTYDHGSTRPTHEHKEDIKVGYNLRRKVVLMGLWAASPMVLHYWTRTSSACSSGHSTDLRTFTELQPCDSVVDSRRWRPGIPHRAAVLHP